MTGFDNMMQTDALISQDRRSADAMVTQSNIAAGQGFAQLNNLPGMMMAREKLDSDLRIQEIAAESQMQQNKLNTMLMMDQVDMSRIGVKQAQLQYDMGKRQYDEYEKNRKDTLQYRRGELNAKMLPYLQRQGETIGADGKRRPMTDQEKADYAAGGRGKGQGGLTADNLMRMANELRQRYTTQLEGFDPTAMNESDKALWQNVNRQLGEMFGVQAAAQMMGVSPGAAGVDPGAALEDAGTQPLPQTPTQAPSANGQARQARQIPPIIQQHGAAALGELDPQMVESFGEAAVPVGIALGVLGEAMERSGQLPPGTAGRHIGQQFMGAANLDLVAYALTAGNYSDAQVRALLIKRLVDDGRADPQKAADAIMGRRTDWMERMLGERGEGSGVDLNLPDAPGSLPPGFDFGSFLGGK